MTDPYIFLFFFLGGVVSIDSEAGWQVMISQPLVACPVAGWLFGNPEVGLMVGILMQLPFLIEIPAGGAKQSFSNLSAFVGAGLAAELSHLAPTVPNVILVTTVTFAILISRVTLPLIKLTRGLNLLLVRRAEAALSQERLRAVSIYQYLGVANAFLFGICFSAGFWLLGKYSMLPLVQSVSSAVEQQVSLLKTVLLGAGVGAMGWLFVKKSTIHFSILGAVVGWGLLLMLRG